MLIKNVKKSFFLFILMLGFMHQSAHAIVLSFDVMSHPNGIRSLDMNAVDVNDYGLVLNNHTFDFLDVKLRVNTATGVASITNGLVRHIGTDDLWHIDFLSGTIGSQGVFNVSGAVPYDTMFNELLNFGITNGYTGYTNSILYQGNTLKLTPLGPISAGGFMGPLDWVSKADGGGNDLYIGYRHRLTHANFAGAQWNRLATAGWWVPKNGAAGNGDFLFVQKQIPATPELSTNILILLGIALMLVVTNIKRIKLAAKSKA